MTIWEKGEKFRKELRRRQGKKREKIEKEKKRERDRKADS